MYQVIEDSQCRNSAEIDVYQYYLISASELFLMRIVLCANLLTPLVINRLSTSKPYSHFCCQSAAVANHDANVTGTE